MPYQYNNDPMMCRCSRSTKLYKHPTDINPTIEAVIETGQLFISDRSVTSGKKVLRQISSSANGAEVPVGYWCPSTVLNMYPITGGEEDPEQAIEYDDSIAVDEVYSVRSPRVTVYTSKDGAAIYQHDLKAKDLLYVDRQITVNCNGTMQTRYHITDTDGDNSVIDKWVLWNGYIGSPNTVEVELPVMKTVSAPKNVTTTQVMSTFTSTDANTPMPLADTDGDGIDDETGLIVDAVDANMGSDAYLDYIASFNLNTSTISLQNVPIGRMTFVHGMPFQYNYITDRRLGATTMFANVANPSNRGEDGGENDPDMYGRTFAKEIAGNMPVMVLTPGKPVYLTKVRDFLSNSGAGTSVLEAFSPFWSDQSSGERNSTMENFLDAAEDSTYDYFSFEVDMTQYYMYANSPCRTSAALMGLNDRYLNGMRCTEIDWAKYNTNATQDYNIFEEVIGLGHGVSFAYDPLSSVSDTLTNSTTESQISGLFNQISGTARELQFVGGQLGASELLNINDYEQALSSADIGNESWLNRVTSAFGNTAKGFNIRFPEIWADSSHTRSYDVDMHFIAPYATNYCKWRYVTCPFLLLFAMAAPHAPSSQSVYGRPFLIRAFSLGYFNVENGIIESITWKRFGDGDMISQNGIPTQIDVSISFKDLYHVLTMGNTAGLSNMGAYFANTGFMDLIGTLSGVNINYLTLGERISFYVSTSMNMVKDIPSTFMRTIQDRFRQIVDDFIYNT